jgi:Carboxypeptidase regulatory-like domain/TonB dependent receptor
MRSLVTRLLSCAAMVVMVSASAGAQEAVNFASIAGRVTDAQNAVLPGATVTVRHVETDVTATVVTDEGGRFRVGSLRNGEYEIIVSLSGFSDARRRIVANVGAAFEVPFVLAVGGITEAINVTAAAQVLESARSQIATTVAVTEVQNLPLNGRQFLDIALLTPGVAPPNINSTQLFAETSANQGVGLSVGSQRNLSNSFIVDGMSANDDAAGLSGMPYGVDAVEQFQVVSSGGQAELGRALGGYVNVVTKSGTNQIRGTAYGFFRDDKLNQANALSGTKLPMSQQQFGASIGGPLKRGRTFYFTNVEQRLLDQSGLTTISPANVATVNARLAAIGYPGQTITTGIYDTPIDSLNLLGKIDHAFSGRDQLSVRYSLYDVTSDNSRGAGGLGAPSASAGIDNRDQSVSVSNTLTLGDRTVHETRAQFTYSNLLAPPTDRIGPAVNIAGVASFGTFPSSPQGRLNKMYQIVDTIAQQRGGHALRAGVDLVYNDSTITFPRAVRGSYAFSSLANFLSGTYNNAGFSQTFGETVVEQGNTNFGVYAQDEWSATPNLTLNFGLRYDLSFLETIETDTNNVSPRVGFAWTPTAGRDLVVRGSAGLFFDRVPLRALANALLSADNSTDLSKLRQLNISLTPGQAGSPVFPNILAAPVPSVTLYNLTTMQTDLQNAYSRQGSLEVEKQVGRYGTASVGYSYLRGRNIMMSINQNVPSCVAAGTNNGCRPNPTYGNNSQYRSDGDSTYHALLVSFARRPGPWGYYRASYTLSKAENNVGEFFFSGPIDPFDIDKDWSRADNDRRHIFVVSAGVNTPMTPATTALEYLTHGFQISTMVQAYSAAPFNITSGVTTVQGTAGRPIVNGDFIARNSGIGDEFYSASLRLSRTFRLARTLSVETAAEVFNLFNAVNEIARNANFGTGAYPTNPSPTFDQVTAVGDPRTWQLALRVRF